jgi:REP-associated tyrosine transposase
MRYAGFDYATAGICFVTICVQHMEQRFGAIVDGRLVLNEAGRMIADTWEANAVRYVGIEIDQYVVMPNHFHAIIFLGADPEITSDGVSLSQIIQSFKSISTVSYAREVKLGRFPPFDRVLWQRGFHDRIVRNEVDLKRARQYIADNPARAELRSLSEDGWW